MYFLVAIYRNDFSRERNLYDLSSVMDERIVCGVWRLGSIVAGLDGVSLINVINSSFLG